MHEQAIVASLLDVVEAEAERRGARGVRSVHLVVGERAGVDDSLRFWFERLTDGTVADGASLEIRRTYMAFRCDPCGREYRPEPARADFACPACGAVGRLTCDATELRLESMEIET